MQFRALMISAMGAAMAGPAFAAEKTFDVGDFTRVSVSAGIEAEISVGPAPSARAEGTDEGLKKLDVYVDGDELVIRRKPQSGFNWGRGQKVTVYVTTPSLTALEASSGSGAKASGVKAANFNADVSSGASASIVGTCEALSADASSGASLDAEGFTCKSVVADASSGASARVHASDKIVADASSGGSVRVYGGPDSVDIDESSGGDVSMAN